MIRMHLKIESHFQRKWVKWFAKGSHHFSETVPCHLDCNHGRVWYFKIWYWRYEKFLCLPDFYICNKWIILFVCIQLQLIHAPDTDNLSLWVNTAFLSLQIDELAQNDDWRIWSIKLYPFLTNSLIFMSLCVKKVLSYQYGVNFLHNTHNNRNPIVRLWGWEILILGGQSLAQVQPIDNSVCCSAISMG